jgi:hypothetical protein
MNIILNNKVVALAIVRTYVANGVLGVVYTLDGARCATLVGKHLAHYFGGNKAMRNGTLFTADAEGVAALLGATLATVTPDAAVDAIAAAGHGAKVWYHPTMPLVRVYVREQGRKDRGYLEFDSERSNWNIDAGMAWGDAKKYAAVAGIAA